MIKTPTLNKGKPNITQPSILGFVETPDYNTGKNRAPRPLNKTLINNIQEVHPQIVKPENGNTAQCKFLIQVQKKSSWIKENVVEM